MEKMMMATVDEAVTRKEFDDEATLAEEDEDEVVLGKEDDTLAATVEVTVFG